MPTQLAEFEVRVVAIDKPVRARRRWNGGPMASEEASQALYQAVHAMRSVLREQGFAIAATDYGVTAREVDD